MKKIIAFYLPQYHPFPENDEWWGKGFTEWDNVKKGKKLYKNHYQPRVPLNQNYYSLLNSETQIWQSELAQQYGIYGFCYYHYWFNGKVLMDKPLQNMLNNKKITINFCFSWANESWSRTWNGKDKDYLIKQEYSGRQDWEKHFMYLLPFFKDERYIKISGKPMLLLYTASNITDCENMVKFWNDRAIQEGFNGIYIVETLNYLQYKPALISSQAVACFEPNNVYETKIKKKGIVNAGIRYFKKTVLNIPNKQAIKKAYEIIEKRKYNFNKIIFEGTFNDWDNTARKGSRGMVWEGASPQLFKEHLSRLVSKDGTGDFLFINAWNEWGEGAYLEPDDKYKYSYLEAISKI